MFGSYLSTAKSPRRCFTLRNGEQQACQANSGNRSNKMNSFIGLLGGASGASWRHLIMNQLMFFNISVQTSATESHNKSHPRVLQMIPRMIIIGPYKGRTRFFLGRRRFKALGNMNHICSVREHTQRHYLIIIQCSASSVSSTTSSWLLTNTNDRNCWRLGGT